MRIIVNKTQYNKILNEQRLFNNSLKEWATYTADIMTPKIIDLNNDFKEDMFAATNLTNKLRGKTFSKNLPIESIIVNVCKNKGEKLQVETFYNPYWSRITEGRDGKKYIVDAEFDIMVNIPPTVDHVTYKDLHQTMITSLTEQFNNTNKWFKGTLNEQKLKLATGVSLLDDEKEYLQLLNFEFYKTIRKIITIEEFKDDGTVTITDDLTQDDMSKIRDYRKTHPESFIDIKQLDGNKLKVSLIDRITFGDDSLFKDENLLSYKQEEKEEEERKKKEKKGVKISGDWIDLAGSKDRAKRDIKTGTISKELLVAAQKAAEKAGVPIRLSTLRTGHNVAVKGNVKISRHCYGDGMDISAFKDTATGKWVSSNASSEAGMTQKFKELGDKVVVALQSLGFQSGLPSSGKSYLWKTNTGGNHFNHIHLGITRSSEDAAYKKIKEWCQKMMKDGKGGTTISSNFDVDLTGIETRILSDEPNKVPWDDVEDWDTFTGIATGTNDSGKPYEMLVEDGVWKKMTWFHSNGSPLEVKTYINGDADNYKVRKYTEDGKLDWAAEYKNDKQNGLYREFYSGTLWYDVNMVNGVRQGVQRYWYDNGRIEKIGKVKNGLEEGLWKEYFDNGKLSREVNYKNGIIDGPIKAFNENGELMDETEFVNGAGVEKGYYENGQLSFETNWKNGKKDGLHREWHENGQLSGEVNYKDGERDGLQKSWYENGQLSSEGNYKNKRGEGLWKRWYENGQLKKEWNYKDGKWNGLYKRWYENGQLYKEVNYKDNVKISEKCWDEEGKEKTCE